MIRRSKSILSAKNLLMLPVWMSLWAAILVAGPAFAQAASAETTPPSQVDAAPAGPDAQLASQLRGIFGALDGLGDVQVTVRSGIVVLDGTVLDTEQEGRAVAIAEKLGGVIAVDSNIQIERDIRRRLMPVLEDLRDRALGWVAMLPTLLLAMVLACFFWWFGRFLAVHEFLTRRWAPNPFVADFLKTLLHAGVFIFGLVLALEIVGASAFLGSILGALGLAGLAVGIAVRDTVENFIASLLLSVRQPFAPQDHVLIDGHEGRVSRLTSRATILMNLEGNHVRIPNATVYKGTLINYSRNPNRRFNFDVGIAADTDITAAQALALETLQSIPGVLEDPGPNCVVKNLGDSNVVLTVVAWVDQTQSGLGKTRSAAIVAIKQRFEREGVGMPEPIYSINMLPGHKDAASADVKRPQQVSAGGPETQLTQEDLAPNHDLERQIEQDPGGQDLLDEDAPKE